MKTSYIELNISDNNRNIWNDCVPEYASDKNEYLNIHNKIIKDLINNKNSFLIYAMYLYIIYMEDIYNNRDIRFNFIKNDFFIDRYNTQQEINNINNLNSKNTIRIIKKYLSNYYNLCNTKNNMIDKIFLLFSNIFYREKNDEINILQLLKNTNNSKEYVNAFNKDYDKFMKEYFYKNLHIIKDARAFIKNKYLETFLNKFKSIGCLPFNNIKSIEMYSLYLPYIINSNSSFDLLLNTSKFDNIDNIIEYIPNNLLYTIFLMSCVSTNIDKNIVPLWNKNNLQNISGRLLSNTFYLQLLSYLYPSTVYHNSLANNIFLNVIYDDGTSNLIFNIMDKFKVIELNDSLQITDKELFKSVMIMQNYYFYEDRNNWPKYEYMPSITYDGNMKTFLIEFSYYYKQYYKQYGINTDEINKMLIIDIKNNKFIFNDEIEYNKNIERI